MFIMKDDRPISNVSLLLTLNEVKELQCALEQLIEAGFDEIHHLHVSSNDYQTEVAVSIFEKNSIERYSKTIRDVLKG